MRAHLLALFMLSACNGGETPKDDTDADTDITVVDPCDACDADATCTPAGDAATCECNPGFDGDGETCVDVDECATGNGGCSADATCDNTDGSFTCTCVAPIFEGDGETCTPVFDLDLAGCAIPEAEHPGYTTIDRSVVLCGSKYDETNIETACHAGWHVCGETEWLAVYPTDRPYKTAPTDPDLIGPTIGTLTSWGASQSDRCDGGVWQEGQPLSATPYDDAVCHYADDEPTNSDGADYLPYNDGKFLFADDGTTILQGRNAEGEADCCSWDVTFGPTEATTDFAVYCCRD